MDSRAEISRRPAIDAVILWTILAVVAIGWPARLAGPLDGIPFDRMSDALILGLLFPALICFHRRFLARRRARALVVALLSWKVLTAALVTQDGWCVLVVPSRPYVRDQTGPPRSWDVRAGWLSANPTCSAIMTRPYSRITEFPVWFFNLPAANGDEPRPEDLPPIAMTLMTVRGALTVGQPGEFQIATTPVIAAAAMIDGQPAARGPLRLAAGTHDVRIDATLTAAGWAFSPLWNREPIWTSAVATMTPPSRVDRLVRPWGRYVPAALAGLLLAVWSMSALTRIGGGWAIPWMFSTSTLLAIAAFRIPEPRWHWAVAALALVCLLPLRPRMRNTFGAFALIGVPWLVFVAAVNAAEIGQMTFYTSGNDWWQSQRFAYRIYLQGYWLEGGERTFWFQPLYRWIAGAVHLVFGDSSVGEEYWDGASLVAMTLFSFHVTKAYAGFRWGLAAAGLTLAVFMAGPGFIFVGHGLSEISSAGFLYLGALLALRSRLGASRMALAAGACATLAVYTRLNNLPMAMAIAGFAWPVRAPSKIIRRPLHLFDRASVGALAIILSTITAGLLLFALRTWYYTGTFSVTLGTALDVTRGEMRRVWQSGMSWTQGLRAAADSVLMVLTTTDPPRLHSGAIPLLAGAAVAFVAVIGLPLFRDLPFAVTIFALSSLVGAVFVRGVAYSGRFSIHIIGAMSTALMCAGAAIHRRALRTQVKSSAASYSP